MADCAFADIACKTTDALNGANEEITADIKDATEIAVEGTFTGWMNAGVPVLGGEDSVVEFLRTNTDWITMGLFGIGVVIFAIGMILKPNKQTIQNGTTYMARLLVVWGGSVVLAAMAIQFFDGFAKWIIDKSLEGDGLASTILSTFAATGPAGFVVAMIFSGIVLFMSLIQGFLLVIRNSMLPVMVALAPAVAAISNTKTGESWWQKYLSWFIAFVLYKPTAAIIYAGGFWLLAHGNVLESENLGEAAIKGQNWMYGVAMMLMAVFTFKALMNVVTPVVGKLTGGMAGAGTMAVSAAALGASGVIGRPKPINPPAAPRNVTPANASAGAPGGQGPTGTKGTPARGATTAAAAATGPAGQAAKTGVETLSKARTGVANSIHNDKDEDR